MQLYIKIHESQFEISTSTSIWHLGGRGWVVAPWAKQNRPSIAISDGDKWGDLLLLPSTLPTLWPCTPERIFQCTNRGRWRGRLIKIRERCQLLRWTLQSRESPFESHFPFLRAQFNPITNPSCNFLISYFWFPISHFSFLILISYFLVPTSYKKLR